MKPANRHTCIHIQSRAKLKSMSERQFSYISNLSHAKLPQGNGGGVVVRADVIVDDYKKERMYNMHEKMRYSNQVTLTGAT